MADMSAIEKLLTEMTDDELLAVLNQHAKGGNDPEPEPVPKPEPVPPVQYRARLADGTEIQVGSQEELDSILASQRREEPVAPQPTAPAFDPKKYHEMLINDPLKAAEYLEMSRNGFPVGQMVPLMAAAIGKMTEKIAELESRGFTNDRAELRDPANKAAIDRIMRERGWQPSYQSMQDAFDIATARGMLKKQEPEPEPAPRQTAFVPPRVPRGTGKEGSEAALIARAGELTDAQLEDFLIQSGVITQRRFS